MTLVAFHGGMVVLSALASLIGLVVVAYDPNLEDNQHILLGMTFGCWLVYCFAWGMLRITPPDLEQLVFSLRAMVGISYLFTFVCVLSLPLSFATLDVTND